ncbi:MAG: 3-isopropylmalate dehydratase [Nitrospinaceae bacterium]|nr:3-isopropylmalate dehydratase [Nitrospinaceae bacterium]NIR53562.1 3-isopropylmalate dehydratase [Nitrospinaceae bacterium]NIS83963.1 3-isopropylmalate dehydratase [Nitrospinaceae bacterium]NIT80772.1 3-isopropylmalate dehydratase [Nitrospinaceae bacterium]NIU43078.1 3-isopropylmalate dehydratase [Nitrospinaceae bacterium]
MKKLIEGRAFVLGNNIDTDQIIPAQHLVYSLSDPEESKNYGKYALSGVPEDASGLPRGHIPFVEEGQYQSPYNIVIGGSNFGCGSSREHAPACMEIAGVEAVVAESYARIFYRNSIDGGFFIPLESQQKLTDEIQTGDEVSIDLESYTLTNKTQNKTYELNSLGDVIGIIEAGNIFEYAKQKGLIQN